jgi:hypothetical protein
VLGAVQLSSASERTLREEEDDVGEVIADSAFCNQGRYL